MRIFISIFLILSLLSGCNQTGKYQLPTEVINHRGSQFFIDYEAAIDSLKQSFQDDSSNVEALRLIAEFRIYQFIFGFEARTNLLPEAQLYFNKSKMLDSTSARFYGLSGKLNFLDWNWLKAKSDFEKSIKLNPNDPDVRHWYCLWLMAMKRTEEAMVHSDTVMMQDKSGNYLIARGSMFYFLEDFQQLEKLMIRAIEKDPQIPWSYDWLGMAYNGLQKHEKSIKTYIKAFEMSDGTVEVGGGLGHALGDAGEIELAKQLTNIYDSLSTNHYLPQVQRAFIHISINEKEKALELLEEAHEQKSWFLAFIQIEHWYNPIRKEKRFQDIIARMNFPDQH